MHDTALAHARLFFETYVADGGTPRILEVGSADVNGGLRELSPPGADYIGVDFATAPGVDVILNDPMVLPFADASFDVCVTSSCFEHAPFFWQTAVEIARVLKPGGLFYLNAPADGPYHAHPHDCWRFFPDAGIAIRDWSRHAGQELVLLESFLGFPGLVWTDFVAVFARIGGPMPAGRMVDGLRGCTSVRRLGPDGLRTIERPPLGVAHRLGHRYRRTLDRLDREARGWTIRAWSKMRR